MPYVIGIVLALITCVQAMVVGLDRDRAFYPTVLVIIASYYILFAVLAGSTNAIIVESIVMAVFVAGSILGFKLSLWWVVGGLAGHGLLDMVHGSLITNPGVPVWWPAFCMSFDVLMAVFLAWLLYTSRNRATPRTAR